MKDNEWILKIFCEQEFTLNTVYIQGYYSTLLIAYLLLGYIFTYWILYLWTTYILIVSC